MKSLLEMRKKAGLSLPFIADKLGVYPSTVMRWERSQDFPARYVVSYAALLGVSPLDLLGATSRVDMKEAA